MAKCSDWAGAAGGELTCRRGFAEGWRKINPSHHCPAVWGEIPLFFGRFWPITLPKSATPKGSPGGSGRRGGTAPAPLDGRRRGGGAGGADQHCRRHLRCSCRAGAGAGERAACPFPGHRFRRRGAARRIAGPSVHKTPARRRLTMGDRIAVQAIQISELAVEPDARAFSQPKGKIDVLRGDEISAKPAEGETSSRRIVNAHRPQRVWPCCNSLVISTAG